jgi:magnesium chelatase family protein
LFLFFFGRIVEIMLAKILSAAVVGLSSVPVTVEVDIASKGLPSFTIVGLPDKAIEESRERVRAAIKNSGAEFPAKRMTVNLAPADLPKIGPAYDLPIAVGILAASGQIDTTTLEGMFVGELSLDGSVRHTNGMLPIVTFGKISSSKAIYLPAVDAKEASIVSGITIYPVSTLLSLVRHLNGSERIEKTEHTNFSKLVHIVSSGCDMADVSGQEHVKRALEIAAAGGHNIFMIGPPGSGKTMLARTLPTILPMLTEAEALDVTNIYSITGNLPPGESVVTVRPFRAPHHTTSRIGLIGGGTHPTPGEISLSHRGVLFLDEFPEFPRHVLEALRQPLEDGFVSLSRAAGTVVYPCKSMLVAAANPCPCGYYGSLIKKCTCMPGNIIRYRKRISGPMLDRIDIHVSVPFVDTEKLTSDVHTAESSESIRVRVQVCRNMQTARYSGTEMTCNADLSTKDVKKYCSLDHESMLCMKKAIDRFGLSARSYYRILKVARTIADLAGQRDIRIEHVAEAIQYRPVSIE